jgi:hypothetical protein
MPTTLSKRKSKSDGREWVGKLGIFVIPILVLTSLAVLAIYLPAASVWISDAAQAEFVGTTGPSVINPTPVAEPQRVLHAAKEK